MKIRSYKNKRARIQGMKVALQAGLAEPSATPAATRPTKSRFGFHTTASPVDPLSQAFRASHRKRPITLVRIPKGKSDTWKD